MKPGVYFTFDVECSMGGAWQNPNLRPISPEKGMMGHYGNRFLGVPLICETLTQNNIRATFFVEPFNDELGYPGETEPVCRYLLEQGQDVQLHIHPNHYHYGLYCKGKPHPRTDQMADLSIEQQKALITEGADRLEKWSQKRPIAFRAGNMGASETTLKALSETDLWIDSSYTFPYVGGQCLFPEGGEYNGSKWYGDILEVGLSGFKQPPWPGLHPAKPIDLMGSSFEECRDAVMKICDAGADAVLILHSFSLFKRKNVQYNGGKPDRIVIKRFERFCRWLSKNHQRYPNRTFHDLGVIIKEKGYQPKSVPPCMINKPVRALTRKAVQGLNRFYWL